MPDRPGRQIGFSPMKCKLVEKKRRRQAPISAAIFHLFRTQPDHICLPAASTPLWTEEATPTSER